MMPTTDAEAASTTSGMEANICISPCPWMFSSKSGRSSVTPGSVVGSGVLSGIGSAVGAASGSAVGAAVGASVGASVKMGWLMAARTSWIRK